MTITTAPSVERRRSLPRRLANDEVAELARLTADLPYLTKGSWSPSLPVGMTEAAMRLQVAVWEVARRNDVDVCTDCTLAQVADALALKGWSTGAARTALRALVMVGGAGDAFSDDVRAVQAVARLIGYFDLRARLG